MKFSAAFLLAIFCAADLLAPPLPIPGITLDPMTYPDEKRRFIFTLSGDRRYEGRVDRSDNPTPDSRSWSGVLEGVPGSFLVVEHRNRRLARLYLRDRTIEIFPANGGFQAVETELRPGTDCLTGMAQGGIVSPAPPDPWACPKVIGDLTTEDPGRDAECAAEPQVQSTHKITAMVVYDEDVVSSYGSVQNTELAVYAYLQEAKEAFKNSKVDATLSIRRNPFPFCLMGPRRCIFKVDYDPATADITEDLRRLIHPDDGFLDDVHQKRRRCKADFVFLIIPPDASPGGVACTLVRPSRPQPEFAFAVVNKTDATSNLVFPHELGHLLGGGHDVKPPAVDGMCDQARAMVFAAPQNAFASLLYGKSDHRRTTFFSSDDPTILYEGVPTGEPKLNNARTVRIAAPIVAGYQ